VFKTPLIAATLTALVVSAAHADLKVVQTTQIDNPQLKAYLETMTPQQRAQMSRSNPMFSGGLQMATVYVRGSKTRADIGPLTYLVDAATKQTITFNRRTHTYSSQPFRMPGNSLGQTSVRDTGQTKVIAGHLSRHYIVTASMPSQPGTLIQSDVWAAQDIAQPPMLAGGGGPLASLQNLLKKVKGYPMKSSLAVTGSPLGNTTIRTNVVSVSKALLSPSVFAVPTGYKKAVTTDNGM
jgi:hypothetical protein